MHSIPYPDTPVLGPERAPRPGAVSTLHGRSALAGPASGSAALKVDRVSHGFKVTWRSVARQQPPPGFYPSPESFGICLLSCGRCAASPRRSGVLEVEEEGGELGIPTLELNFAYPRSMRDRETPQRRVWGLWREV